MGKMGGGVTLKHNLNKSKICSIITFVLMLLSIASVFGCNINKSESRENESTGYIYIMDGDYELFYIEKDTHNNMPYKNYNGLEGYIIVEYYGNDESIIIPTKASDGKPIIGIGEWVFCKNDILKSVIIPDGISCIFSYAFLECNQLESIYIGSTINYIEGCGTFAGKSIKNIYIDSSNKKYKSDNNCIIEKETNTLIAGCPNSTIPEYVKCIGECAFTECSTIKTINIPDSVEKICMSAFNDCKSLEYIYLSNNIKTIEECVFVGCPNLEIECEIEEKPDGWDESWAGSFENNNTYPTVKWGIYK